MVVPHLELRKYIQNPNFDILQTMGTFGFPISFNHREYRGIQSKLNSLFNNSKNPMIPIILNGRSKDLCYICSFEDEEDKFGTIDLYTPEFRRFRNTTGLPKSSIDTLCEILSQELKDDVVIRRVDFRKKSEFLLSKCLRVKSDNSHYYDAINRIMYDNKKGNIKINGSIPQIKIGEEFFS
ncbi:MAG: hypothetical protein LAT82_00640 [Nanoarchaeota archaeon]|nr:hypothetical protein [Nanoarchaeota archaeon]